MTMNSCTQPSQGFKSLKSIVTKREKERKAVSKQGCTMSTGSPTIAIMRWTGIARSNEGQQDKGERQTKAELRKVSLHQLRIML